jgi:hypothetical protein
MLLIIGPNFATSSGLFLSQMSIRYSLLINHHKVDKILAKGSTIGWVSHIANIHLS